MSLTLLIRLEVAGAITQTLTSLGGKRCTRVNRFALLLKAKLSRTVLCIGLSACKRQSEELLAPSRSLQCKVAFLLRRASDTSEVESHNESHAH